MSRPATAPQLFYIAVMTFILMGLPVSALNVAWLYIQDTFGLSLDALGVLLGVSTAGRLLMSLSAGPLTNRIGLGRFLLLGSLTLLIGLLGFALAPAWWLLVIFGMVYGVGFTMLNTGINTFAAAHYGPSRMNWLHAFFGVGTVIGPLLVTVAIFDLGLNWRWSYGFMTALVLALALIFLLTQGRWAIDPTSTEAEGPRVSAGDTLRLPVVWLSLALFFIHSGTQISSGQLANSLFTEGRGLDPRLVGTWISIFGASLTVGRIVTGLLVDRVGDVPFLRWNMLGTVIGAALIWLQPSELLAFLGLSLMGFTLGPGFPTLVSATPRRVGLRHTANTIGFMIAGGGIGAALVPGLAGVLAERWGLEVIGVVLVVASALTFIMYEILVANERRHVAPVQVEPVGKA